MSSSYKQIMTNSGTTQFLGTRRDSDISRRKPLSERQPTRKQRRALRLEDQQDHRG